MRSIYKIYCSPQAIFPPGFQSVRKVHVNVEGGLNSGGWETSYRMNPRDASVLFLLPCIESLYLCGLDGTRDVTTERGFTRPALACSSLKHLYLHHGACYIPDYIELLRCASHLISFVSV